MSLYSGIAVPAEIKAPIKRPGIAGLYDDPTTIPVIESPVEIVDVPEVEERKESNAGIPTRRFYEL